MSSWLGLSCVALSLQSPTYWVNLSMILPCESQAQWSTRSLLISDSQKLFDFEKLSKMPKEASGWHISLMMAPQAPSPTQTVPLSVGALPTSGLVLLNECTWFSKTVITLYLSKLGTQWNSAQRNLSGLLSNASQTLQIGTWQLVNLTLSLWVSKVSIMYFFCQPSKPCMQPESSSKYTTLAKVKCMTVRRRCTGGTCLMIWKFSLRSQCCGKQIRNPGPLLSTVMLTPGSQFKPASWLPTVTRMGIMQPRVAVIWPYIFRKESQVYEHAGMLSSQAISPPMKNTSGLSVATILLRLTAPQVYPLSPALIILMGVSGSADSVLQIPLVQN